MHVNNTIDVYCYCSESMAHTKVLIVFARSRIRNMQIFISIGLFFIGIGLITVLSFITKNKYKKNL